MCWVHWCCVQRTYPDPSMPTPPTDRQEKKKDGERDRARDIQTSKNSNEASLPAPLLYCADAGASESWRVDIGLGEQTGGYPYRIQRLQGSA